MTAAEAPDWFGSRWRAVRGLRLPGLGHDAFYHAAGQVAAVAVPFLTADTG